MVEGVHTNNIIDKTFGNGLEPYKNESRIFCEGMQDGDVLLLVPSFFFKVNTNHKGKVHRNLIGVHSLDTCHVVYQRVAEALELVAQEVQLVTGNGEVLNSEQFVESVDLLQGLSTQRMRTFWV